MKCLRTRYFAFVNKYQPFFNLTSLSNSSPTLFSFFLFYLIWTRIFHMRPHLIGETRFYLWKNCFGKSELPLILFYFKRKNKIRKKTLKKWLHSIWKSVSLKNPSLGPGINLLIGKVPLKSSTPLSPTKISIN